MDLAEHCQSPLDQVQRVDIVDIFLALIHLTFDPMPVKVAEKVIDILRSCCVSVPFFDVEAQKSFVGMCFRL